MWHGHFNIKIYPIPRCPSIELSWNIYIRRDLSIKTTTVTETLNPPPLSLIHLWMGNTSCCVIYVWETWSYCSYSICMCKNKICSKLSTCGYFSNSKFAPKSRVLNNFWTKSVSYKSKPIPVSRDAEMRWKTITLAPDIFLSHNDCRLIL